MLYMIVQSCLILSSCEINWNTASYLFCTYQTYEQANEQGQNTQINGETDRLRKKWKKNKPTERMEKEQKPQTKQTDNIANQKKNEIQNNSSLLEKNHFRN